MPSSADDFSPHERLNQLADQHFGGIDGLTHFLCGILSSEHPNDDQDIAQEALIRISRTIDQFSEIDGNQSGFKGWVRTVAVNVGRDHLRKQGRRKRLLPLYADSELARLAPDHQEETVREKCERICVYLDRLPTVRRRLVISHYLNGISVAELAESLGVSENTIYNRLAQSRQALRALFEGQSD